MRKMIIEDHYVNTDTNKQQQRLMNNTTERTRIICNQTVNTPTEWLHITVRQFHTFHVHFHIPYLPTPRDHQIDTFNRNQTRLWFPGHSLQHGMRPIILHRINSTRRSEPQKYRKLWHHLIRSYFESKMITITNRINDYFHPLQALRTMR